MKINKNVLIMILLLFIGALSLYKKLPQSSSISNNKSDTTIIHDTTWVTKIEKQTIYKPGPTVTLPGDTQWLNQPIDTMLLLKDYHLSRIYNDTFLIDTFGYVSWVDTVNKNTIQSRQKTISYRLPLIKEKTIINNYYLQPRQINASLHVDLIKSIIYGGFLYEDKKDNMYHLNVGLGVKGSSLMIGMSTPIWTKK